MADADKACKPEVFGQGTADEESYLGDCVPTKEQWLGMFAPASSSKKPPAASLRTNHSQKDGDPAAAPRKEKKGPSQPVKARGLSLNP